MFGTSNTSVVGSLNIDQYTPKRTANSVFNNTLAAGQQQADARNFSSPFRGRGIQAGGSGQRYFQQSRALSGLMDARNSAQQASMGIYQQNRAAEQQAQIGQAKEFASMAKVAGDQDEADWSERFTQAAAEQQDAQAMRKYRLNEFELKDRAAAGLLSGLYR